jgi:hypothetical protein
VNEGLVGLGSLAGVLGAGWFIQRTGTPGSMYLVCGIILLLAVPLQAVAASSRRTAFPD